jgi:aminoglycoside phosphotransferase (APT) family kinase protein
MHPGQVDITPATAHALATAQFPQWRDLPITPVRSGGTVNALYRLGDDIVLRFPLEPVTDPAELLAEQDHARLIQPHVPVQVPEPLALGHPGTGYAGYWTAYRWIPGHPPNGPSNGGVAPDDLAAFVTALHGIDTGGRAWPGNGRGGPLHDHDDWVHHSLARSTHLTDTRRLAEIWNATPDHHGADVWIHADLMPGNLLVRDNRLAAVIDLGAVTIGDPAVDYMPAWNLFDPGRARRYRHALDASDEAWQRGRGWALLQAIGSLWYYEHTNPAMHTTAGRTLDAILKSTTMS